MICPNKNLPEWKTLVNTVGELEAYRDFFETSGEIRSPELVQAKVDERVKKAAHEALNPTYSAVFVNTDAVIEEYKPVHPNVYSHHSTIEFRPKDVSSLPIGEEMDLEIIGRLTTDRVDVLLVNNPLSANEHPHITLSTAEGVLPVESNVEIANNLDKVELLSDVVPGTIGIFNGAKAVTVPEAPFPDGAGVIDEALRQDEDANGPEAMTDQIADRIQAVEIATKLSEMLGIDYHVITTEQAAIITKNANNPWSNQPSFFVGGTVYIIGEYLSTSNVFHEFAHPFVRHLLNTEPAAVKRLFNQLLETQEGQAIVADLQREGYSLPQTDDKYIEEVIVRAITKRGVDKINNLKSNSAFKKVIDNIMYLVKKALRNLFGKVVVSKLDVDTSLNDLADMLVKGGKFLIDKRQVSQRDFVAYNAEARKEFIDDFVKLDDKSINGQKHSELQAQINRFFDISVNHINKLLRNRNYDDLRSILTDEDKRGDIQEMKANLQQYQTNLGKTAKAVVDDMEHTRNKATALVNSLFRLDTVIDKMLTHVKDLSETAETQESLQKAYYYKHMLDHWQEFINEAKEAIDESDIRPDSPIVSLLSGIETGIRKTNKYINKMYAAGVRDTLYEELLPMQEKIAARYETIIQNLIDKKASPARIDKAYKEYHGVTREEHERLNALKQMSRLTSDQRMELNELERKAYKGIAITKDKIEAILAGGVGDANFFNSYLEGYLYNTDPVIGGLAAYVKRHLNEVQVTAQSKYNNFAKDIEPLLKDAGFNAMDPKDLGKRMGFLDKVARKDDKGNVVERLVWTFKNMFKNYRYDYDMHKDVVEKAQRRYAETGLKEDEDAMIEAVIEQQKFLRDYFHQEYVPAFYKREELFEKDAIGKTALFRRKDWNQRYRALTEPAKTPEQQLEIADQVDAMWIEYRQMSSLYKPNGVLKTGDELEIAKRIQEYKDAGRAFYETTLREGVFQNALKSYEQQLIDGTDTRPGLSPDSEEFRALREVWIEKNTVRAPKQGWKDKRNELYSEMNAIYKKLPKSQSVAVQEQKLLKEINDLKTARIDDQGQAIATELKVGARKKIFELEKELAALRKKNVGLNGLTRAQNDLLSDLLTLQAGKGLTPKQQAKLNGLFELMDQGLNKFEKQRIASIKKQLQGLARKEATDYYIDTMNNWIDNLTVKDPVLKKGIDKLSADWLLEPGVVNKLLNQNNDFDKWFYSNHHETERYNKATKTLEKVWVRSTMWDVTVPVDPADYESIEVDGETIHRKPIMKYYARRVKSEFRTKRVVGHTVDNQYQWLPKTLEQGAVSKKYINEEYEALASDKDNPEYKLLEKLKEHHLLNQEGLNGRSKLYYDLPRIRKNNLELITSKHFLTNMVQRIKDWFSGTADDAMEGHNYFDKFNLVRMDIFDNEITGVPIHGLYDMDEQDISLEITRTMMQYMLSAERQKQLIKISPTVRAIQTVVSSNKLNKTDANGVESINRQNFFNRGIFTFLKQKGDSVRKKTVDNFIEREFEGKNLTGAGSNVPWLNNAATVLFKRASFGFFAFNIPSALKNSYGAKFQGLIEASAGEHMTHMSFQKGNGWAYATMGELSFGGQLYQKGPKSLNQQKVEIFDPSQGRFEERFGEGLSRTIAHDVASFSWLYNFRKWVELQATLQIFAGMMYHQKVTRTLPDGKTEEIAYMDAWELRDKKIQLKEGVDPEWGITYDEDGNLQMGKKFSSYKNTMQQVMNNLQGAYSKFDQPEAQRYLVFRFLSYLRRYFTTMTLNRFGFSGRWSDPKPRINPGLGDVQMGFYITFIKTLKETITSLGKNLMSMQPEEKKAALKVITELGGLMVVNLALSLLFGWDPDDDEKYEKLRARSASLPFPMTATDPDREFNGWGFVENHMMFLLMNIRAENEQFLPFPGYGLDDYTALLDLKSIAFGPTVKTYKDIFEDVLDILEGNERAYYKRTVGPYKWQQEGGGKIWAHIGRTLGLTGSSLDPAKAIKGFQSVQSRAR